MEKLYNRRDGMAHAGNTEVSEEEGMTARVLGQMVSLLHIIKGDEERT